MIQYSTMLLTFVWNVSKQYGSSKYACAMRVIVGGDASAGYRRCRPDNGERGGDDR